MLQAPWMANSRSNRITAPVLYFGLHRKYGGNYAIRVRRGLDNAELDIGYVDDALDTTALLNFATDNGNAPTGSATVSVFYNQMTGGSSQNFEQTTAGNQPVIVNSGALVTHISGGKPAIDFMRTREYSNNTSYCMYLSDFAGVFKGKNYARLYLNASFYSWIDNIIANTSTRNKSFISITGSSAYWRLHCGWGGAAYAHDPTLLAYTPDGTGLLGTYNYGGADAGLFYNVTALQNYRFNLNTGHVRLRSKKIDDTEYTEQLQLGSGFPASFANTDATSFYLNARANDTSSGTHVKISAFALYDTYVDDSEEAATEAHFLNLMR